MDMHLIQLRITSRQKAWIDEHTDQLFKTPDLIRGLIDTAMGTRVIPLHMVDRSDTLSTGHAGAGEQEREKRNSLPYPPSPSEEFVSKKQTRGGVADAGPQGAEGDASAAVAPKVPQARGVGKKRNRPDYSPEFQKFWATYQASPNKANQTKPLAFEAFKEALVEEPAERLTEAAERLVKQQARQISAGEFNAPLKDCFRWLRDGGYEAMLEDIETINPVSEAVNDHPCAGLPQPTEGELKYRAERERIQALATERGVSVHVIEQEMRHERIKRDENASADALGIGSW